MGSRFGALAEEEYDKIAPVIACTLPALTDSIPERKRGELAGEVTSELQVNSCNARLAGGGAKKRNLLAPWPRCCKQRRATTAYRLPVPLGTPPATRTREASPY